MSKIFRIYREGTSTYRGWNENPAFPYNQNARETIADPDGANAKNEITSIPSPFARIDLIKTAFKEVCRRASQNLGQLDGNTIYHKMVSDTLDVGEIFFNIDKLNDKVEIITWEPQANLAALKADGNVSHYYVADSLEKFLQSDASAYNFGRLQNIYLLNYKAGPDELNIIGATSPATFFFSGANSLDYVTDIYFADNDRPFDSDYQPLYRRDFEYLKAWWTLRKTTPDFSRLFPEVDEYLNLTFKAIKDNDLKQKLNGVGVSSLDDYSVLDVASEGRIDQVEVLGISLLKKKAAGNVSQSDFTIKSEFAGEEKVPLVLPIEAGNKYADLNYVNGRFGKENKAPYVVGIDDYTQRSLPFDGSQHPYLTISDFLEDNIIEVPHRLNTGDYFDGNLVGCKARVSYLLPLKPLYFKFFTTSDLMSDMPDGKKAFEMQMLAGGSVSVTLRVPISGNSRVRYIEYMRKYYKNNAANVLENSGGIVKFEFAGFVMPGVKFQSDASACYTISSITLFSVQANLQFYKGFASIQGVGKDCRDDKNSDDGFKVDTYTLCQSNFDFIRVSRKDGISGILCPKFAEHQELNSFEFAVDLGTSNTHIEEMKSGNKTSEPFRCKGGDSLMSKFYVPYYREIDGKRMQEDLLQEEPIMDTDYLPAVIGCGADAFFPTRTAMACAKTIDWSKSLRVLGLLNFNMMHDKKKERSYNTDPLVNIKWSNDAHAKEAMRLYIENILLIIRNKVIRNNGRLSQTKITWFYPDSMSGLRLSQMKQAWNDAYHKMFNPSADTFIMSESVAPIRYYFNLYSTATNIVNVDIGGGTTDIAFSKGGNVDYITSFRFAANALFQDSLSDINPRNGIIDYFQNRFGELLHGTDEKITYGDLPVIYDRNVNSPANMASFLFSLKNISFARQFSRSEIDFNYILQGDEKFKIVFVLFYTAIIYHIAQIVKSKGLDLPRHISFSGNGSRIVSVVTTDMEALSSYTKCVFEQVLGVKYNSELDILGFGKDNNPKEATCKGGLLPSGNHAYTGIENLVLKDSDGQFIVSSDRYSTIDEEYKKQVVASVQRFFDVALDVLPRHFDMRANFAITSETLGIAREVCRKDLHTFLDKGINLSVAECGGDASSEIEEALAFYPIKGAVQALSENLYEYYKVQN